MQVFAFFLAFSYYAFSVQAVSFQFKNISDAYLLGKGSKEDVLNAHKTFKNSIFMARMFFSEDGSLDILKWPSLLANRPIKFMEGLQLVENLRTSYKTYLEVCDPIHSDIFVVECSTLALEIMAHLAWERKMIFIAEPQLISALVY